MGDQVEIISSEYQEPQEKWFDYLATSSAKTRLKNGIKDFRKSFKDKGKAMLKEYFDNAKLDFSKQNRNTLAEKFNLANRNDLYYMVATNKIGQQDVESVLKKDAASWSEYLVKYLTLGIVRPSSERKNDKNEENPGENGVSGYVISTCCNPIPGDDVVAIQLPGQPIQIHHPDCVEAQKLMSDAKLLAEAGCFAVVLEKVPAKLADEVTKAIKVPTIGIGAGGHTDGQILVIDDMLGKTQGFSPRFLRRYANLFEVMTDAIGQYVTDVKACDFPNEQESY